MSINERRKYLHKMKLGYCKAKRKLEKGQLLDEMEAISGLHRKSLIRLINGDLSRKLRRKERGKIYGAEVVDAVRVIARSLDHPCAERLRLNLTWLTEHLTKHTEMEIDAETIEKLERVSVSTLQHILKRVGRSSPRTAHRKAPRKSSRHMVKDVPMRQTAWDEPQPGHFKVDLVYHCGDHLWTIRAHHSNGGFSHWLERMYSSPGTQLPGDAERFCVYVSSPAYRVLEIHPDNGSEFFSGHLMRLWEDKAQGIEITRSFPYKK